MTGDVSSMLIIDTRIKNKKIHFELNDQSSKVDYGPHFISVLPFLHGGKTRRLHHKAVFIKSYTVNSVLHCCYSVCVYLLPEETGASELLIFTPVTVIYLPCVHLYESSVMIDLTFHTSY